MKSRSEGALGDSWLRGRRARHCFRAIVILILACILLGADSGDVPPTPSTARDPNGRQKIDASLREIDASPGHASGPMEFIVLLEAQGVVGINAWAEQREAASPGSNRDAQPGRHVEDLRAMARHFQAPLLKEIAEAGAWSRSFFAANMIHVRGPRSLMEELARDAAVARILENRPFRLGLAAIDPIIPSEPAPAPLAPLGIESIEPNLGVIGAPEVWAMGFRGQGVVMAGADTGYDWEHPALQAQYRGWDGNTADHAYNWHDAIHTGGGGCGADSPVPCDDHDHGTHTMGIMLGDDGAGNQIGVAPDARWIGCRNMDQGSGTPTTYTECFEWFMAPTDENGLNPDPGKAPHVITNSWTCPDSEGCIDPQILQIVIANTRDAGIFVAAAAANAGPACGTIVDPPAIYPESFTVGATNNNDLIASLSGRGPVAGSTIIKPDVTAPGIQIRSALRGGGYTSFSGTSMATPHVAGLVALLISARPELAGNVPALEDAIRQSAHPIGSLQGCGGDLPGQVPNYAYGYGRIDAVAAIWQVLLPLPGLSAMGALGIVAALGWTGFRRGSALQRRAPHR